MPLTVAAVLTIVASVLPEESDWVAVVALVLPIGGFFVRMHVGMQNISTNYCPSIVQSLQYVVMGLAALAFIAVECLMVLTFWMADGAIPANPEEGRAILMVFASYYLAMTFAAYPGQREFPQAYARIEDGDLEYRWFDDPTVQR